MGAVGGICCWVGTERMRAPVEVVGTIVGVPWTSQGGIRHQVGTEQTRVTVGVVGTIAGAPCAPWGGFTVGWAPSGRG